MKKILVIEDDKDLLDNTAEVLSLSNYEVITATNGRQGIEQAILHKPDLILCDIIMPQLDGYAVLSIIRRNKELKCIPFIFITATTEKSGVRKAMSLGADDYITKPFETDDLLKAIDRRLKKAERIKATIKTEIHKSIATTGEEQLKKFLKGRHADHFRKTEHIFSEGNQVIGLFYLSKGRVKLFKRYDDGRELILNIINEGELFGYTALLNAARYSSCADALEDCEIIAIPKTEFDELMNYSSAANKMFAKLLAKELADKQKQLVDLAYNSLRKRVADAVLIVKERYGDQPRDYGICLTRDNLACVVGSATVSLIRTLTDFKEEKLIDIKDYKITVLNEEKLRTMLN